MPFRAEKTIRYGKTAFTISEITNKNFKTYFIENGEHSGVLNPDDESVLAYRAEKDAQLEQLKQQYDGNIPTDKLKEFYSSLDKHKYNDVNHETMGQIIEFFGNAK